MVRNTITSPIILKEIRVKECEFGDQLIYINIVLIPVKECKFGDQLIYINIVLIPVKECEFGDGRK
jgi:hypothetical protein